MSEFAHRFRETVPVLAMAAGLSVAACGESEPNSDIDRKTEEVVNNNYSSDHAQPENDPLGSRDWEQIRKLVAIEVGKESCDFIAGPGLNFDSSNFPEDLTSASNDFMENLTTEQDFLAAWEMISEIAIEHYGLVEEDWVSRAGEYWSEFDGQKPRLIGIKALEDTELGQEMGIEAVRREPFVVAHEVWPESGGNPVLFANIFARDGATFEFVEPFPNSYGVGPQNDITSPDDYRCY